MKCVAIDDEPIALSILKEYCRRYGNIELNTFTSPVEGLEAIRETNPDFVFLDIEINSHNGIEIAKLLPKNICVIFTTAYSQYAVEGFNVDAVDFLHKPIFYPRFEQAMHKVERCLQFMENIAATDNVLTLKVEHQNVVVKISEITYVEAMDNYIRIFRKNLPAILTQMTMKDMENKLPKEKFIRLHRSYIVSISEIEKFSNRQIFLRGLKRSLPVGRKYLDSFKSLNELLKKE